MKLQCEFGFVGEARNEERSLSGSDQCCLKIPAGGYWRQGAENQNPSGYKQCPNKFLLKVQFGNTPT